MFLEALPFQDRPFCALWLKLWGKRRKVHRHVTRQQHALPVAGRKTNGIHKIAPLHAKNQIIFFFSSCVLTTSHGCLDQKIDIVVILSSP
jgi:hypothetical protein